MLKFFEFLHQMKVIFFFRFRGSMYFCTPNAAKNEKFRRKSPYPLRAFEGGSSFLQLEPPSFSMQAFNYSAFLAVPFLLTKWRMPSTVPIVRRMPTGKVIHALGTKPEKRNITKDMPATVIA